MDYVRGWAATHGHTELSTLNTGEAGESPCHLWPPRSCWERSCVPWWETRKFGSSLVGLGESQVIEGLEKSERGDMASENLVAPLVNHFLLNK